MIFTRRVYSAYIFDSRHPPPFCAGSSWGLLSRKIFFDFYFPDFARISQKSGLRIFWILYSLFLIIKFLEYFSRVNIKSYLFRLVSALSILCFISSTLYLFDSSACYKQTFMLMRVCFMLILAILRLSDVFSFVLGEFIVLG